MGAVRELSIVRPRLSMHIARRPKYQLNKIRFTYYTLEKPLRSRLSFKSQGLNGRQALLGALKRILVREREAQEEGKERSPSSRVSRASRTPLSDPPKRGLCRT